MRNTLEILFFCTGVFEGDSLEGNNNFSPHSFSAQISHFKKMTFFPSPASHCNVWITKTARLLVRLRNNYTTTQLPRFFPPRHGCCEAVAAKTVSATCIPRTPTTRRVNARFETGEAVTCGQQMGVQLYILHVEIGKGVIWKDRTDGETAAENREKSLSRFPGWEIELFQYTLKYRPSICFCHVWMFRFEHSTCEVY